MESGGPVGTAMEYLPYYSSPVENLTLITGCHSAKDQLACLRSLSSEALYNAEVTQVWNPSESCPFAYFLSVQQLRKLS